jgi:mono/diheme cytochrome c family protein
VGIDGGTGESGSMTALPSVLRGVAGALFGVVAFVTPASAQSRGELLYSTHCGACHTAQMHWRAGRAVTDWTSLTTEVRKWQIVASLAWGEDDVLEVARYLNDSIYHFELMNATSASTRQILRTLGEFE